MDSINRKLISEILFEDYREDIKPRFEIVNHGYFKCFEDFVWKLIYTSKQIELVKDNPDLVSPILIVSVAGMNRELGALFNYELSSIIIDYINWKDDIARILEQAYYKRCNNTKESTIHEYYFDKEYAILSLNIALKDSTQDKIEYLAIRKKYYETVCETKVLHESDQEAVKRYILFCDLYIELLELYGDEISKIRVNINEVRNITFIDEKVSSQFMNLLTKAKKPPKYIDKFIPSEFKEDIDNFIEYGRRSTKAKIVFNSDQKTLAYCFHQLHKHKLINRVDDPSIPLTYKELASIIYENFRAVKGTNENTLYDYLRSENNRPLNPVFEIKEETDKTNSVTFKLYKPSFLRKGDSIQSNV
jgi:hypothetical protein